jgi:rhodanese-related sulfurtransferase
MSSGNKNNYIIPFIIFLVIFFVFVLAFTKFNTFNKVDISELGDTLIAEEFFVMGHEPNVEILDLRTPEEYNYGHIGGVSNINFYDTLNFISYLNKLDKNKTYLIYCHTDRRSGQTLAMMKDKGFSDVHLLKGGILAWKLDERPVIKESIK